MRIGVIGDIHGDASALREVLDILSQQHIDMLLLPGDIGPNLLLPASWADIGLYAHSPGDWAVDLLLEQRWQRSVLSIEELLCSLGVPVYLVPGNHDAPNYPIANTGLVFNCDRRLVEAGDIQIVGLGGSNRTPLGWPYEWSDLEIESAWAKLQLHPSGLWILLSHTAPRGSGLDLVNGKSSVGSSFVRELIRRASPFLCICSHIHEGFGVKSLDQTLAVNAGSVRMRRHLHYADQTSINSSGHSGYQALLLDCSQGFQKIEVADFFVPSGNSGKLIVTKNIYHFDRNDCIWAQYEES